MGTTKEPVAHTDTDENGVFQKTYTVITKITPFFDFSQGMVYNIQSVAMLLSPLCMALGVYLSIVAHHAIYPNTTAPFEGDLAGLGAVEQFQNPAQLADQVAAATGNRTEAQQP